MAKTSLVNRVRGRVRRDLKRYYWRSRLSRKQDQRILFIVGNQRSGTTMLLELFERDLRSRTFSEYSSITEHPPENIRLKPLDEVRDLFGTLREPLLVCKPLVESQRTRELLDYFAGSSALWAYRHYYDAVSSNVKRFHSQVESCRIIVDNEPGNWRSEQVPQDALELIRRFYDKNMNPQDAAALMWYARNCLYFSQHLQNMPSVQLWKYEDFVQNPAENLARIYTWLKMNPPGRRVINFVSSRSVGLGSDVTLHKEIESSCRDLLDRLDELYKQTIVAFQ